MKNLDMTSGARSPLLGKGPRNLLAATGFLILVSCNAAPPIATPSGQPEITLHNVDATCVKSGLLNAFVNDGWSVKSTTENQIVAGRPSRNAMANMLLSTPACGNPEERLNALLIPLPNDGMRIVVSEAYVSNAGTAFERTTPISQSQAVQNQFLAAGTRTEAACRKS